MVLLVAAGCGDGALNGGALDLMVGGGDGPVALPGADLSATVDGGPLLDLASPAIGRACPAGSECATGLFCLDEHLQPMLPPDGYCTMHCNADADCGPGAFCGPAFPGTGQLCFRACNVAQDCQAGQVCGRRFDGLIDLGRTACLAGNPSATDGDACATFADCNRNMTCVTNPFEAPGGLCATVGCTPGDNTTCAGASSACTTVSGGASICLRTCSAASNTCRAGEGYACIDTGAFGIHVCSYPKARPGAACNVDTDCGRAPWSCVKGPSFPGGACGAVIGNCSPGDDSSCPDGARCVDPTPLRPNDGDQFCALSCTADAECRTAEGYTCQGPAGGKSCRH